MDNNGFSDVRLFYTKTASAKYISHLDVMRAFQRAFRRARIPVWYTEGFHPHLYLTFALPLSLGYESLCESVDFRVTEDMTMEELERRLREALPPGFGVMSVGKPEMQPSEIKTALYHVSFKAEGDAAAVIAAWDKCFAATEVCVMKHTKRGEKSVDIKPLIRLGGLKEESGTYCCEMELAAGTEMNINPSLVFEAFAASSGIETTEHSVVRKAVLTESGQTFR